MSQFAYVAFDPRGRETRGLLEVASQAEAIIRLREMGFFPSKVVGVPSPASATAPGFQWRRPATASFLRRLSSVTLKVPGRGGRISSKALMGLTRQMATLIAAGMPLLRGLRLIEEQERNQTLRRVVSEIARDIEGGATFSEALGRHPRWFNRLYVNMVKAGEAGGVLELVLKRLAEFMEKAQRIKGKVVAAMFYPVAVTVVAAVILSVLMVFVVPRFKEVFDGLLNGAQMPAFTLFVLRVSEWLRGHLLLAAGAALAVGMAARLLSRTRWGRRAIDVSRLRIPLLGPVMAKVAISRFTRTLGTLASSGVPILQALTIVKETTGNVVIADAAAAVHTSVKEGETITAPLKATGVFPPIVVGMIDVGEQTGALPEMLMKIADDFDEEVDNSVAALTSLLEPMMIVFLALIVGSIVIALFLPLLRVMEGDFTQDATTEAAAP